MIGSVAVVTTALLAANPASNQPGGQGQEFGSSSPVALIVLILFFIAVAFLARSMSKHLKRTAKHFDAMESPAAEDNSVDGLSDRQSENQPEPMSPQV